MNKRGYATSSPAGCTRHPAPCDCARDKRFIVDDDDERENLVTRMGDLALGAKVAMAVYCQQHGIEVDLIRSGSRVGQIPKHQVEMATKLVTEIGLSMVETGRQLGMSTSGVAQIMRRR